MWAQLTWKILLSLVLRLLFLKPVATGSCSGDAQGLVNQLQRQADIMQDTSRLLDPYIHIQGLDFPGLKEHCQESPGFFPKENALHGLSRKGFLRTLKAKLGHVLHRLTTFQQELPPEVQDFGTEKMYIHGIRNNIYCLAQLLPGSSETAEPTQPGSGASSPPPPASDIFQRKLQGCQFLRGYHRFMHSVGQVFRKWKESPSRSRRHSPRQALQKGARKMQPPMKGKRLMPRRQLPR